MRRSAVRRKLSMLPRQSDLSRLNPGHVVQSAGEYLGDNLALATDHVAMLSKDTLARFQDAAILWSVGSGTAADVVAAACDCLVAGVDSPTLRILAGISPVKGSESDELRRWLEGALAELSLAYYPEGSREGEEEALRIMARRLLAENITPRDLTSWAYRFITWDGTPLAAELIGLDNTYEYVDAVAEAQQYPSDAADIDADVIAEARRLVGDTTTAEKD